MLCRFSRTVVLTVALLLTGAGMAHASIQLSFDPSSQTVFLGNTVSVDLKVSGLGGGVSPALGGFQFNILYDPTIIKATSVTFGLDLGDPGASEALISSDVTAAGSASLAEVSLLPSPALLALQPATFTMATLVFQTKSVGTSPLSYDSVLLSDEAANVLSFSPMTGSITVVSPEPGFGAMVGAVLVVIGIRFRACRK